MKKLNMILSMLFILMLTSILYPKMTSKLLFVTNKRSQPITITVNSITQTLNAGSQGYFDIPISENYSIIYQNKSYNTIMNSYGQQVFSQATVPSTIPSGCAVSYNALDLYPTSTVYPYGLAYGIGCFNVSTN